MSEDVNVRHGRGDDGRDMTLLSLIDFILLDDRLLETSLEHDCQE